MPEKQKVEKKGKIKKFFKSVFGGRKRADELVEEGKWSKPTVRLTSQSLQGPQVQQIAQQKTKQSTLQKFRNKLARNTSDICILFGEFAAGFVAASVVSFILGNSNQGMFFAISGLSLGIAAIVGLYRVASNSLQLLRAAANGDTEKCKKLIENGAEINAPEPKAHITPLIIAAEDNHKETVKYLLSEGANPFLKDKDGKTAYDLAGKEEVKQIIKAFENLWKIFGGKQALKLIQNINAAVRECSPDKIYSIFENL